MSCQLPKPLIDNCYGISQPQVLAPATPLRLVTAGKAMQPAYEGQALVLDRVSSKIVAGSPTAPETQGVGLHEFKCALMTSGCLHDLSLQHR